MKLERLLIKMLHGVPENAESPGHQLSLRGGYVHQTGAGLYTFTPLGLRVLVNIGNVIRREMDRLGCQEILMPMVAPASLWIESGRYGAVDVLLKFRTRGGMDSVLNPTHEEVVCDYVRSCLQSYRQLPFSLYQIQTKYRDELRARAGLIRCREFLMKDAYSFHSSQEDLENFYGAMLESYHLIYRKIGLEGILDVAAPVGDMGGRMSHEFQLISPIGEDRLYLCSSCDYRCNGEMLGDARESSGEAICPMCKGRFREVRGIEVGNIFQLGTKYSESMGVFYNDEKGKRCNPTMGCYGIGVSRSMAAIFEQRAASSAGGVFWNMIVAPYRVHIMTLGNSENISRASKEIYGGLQRLGIEAMVDDGEDRAGSKFTNFELIGSPIGIVVSDRYISQGSVEMRYANVRGDYPTTLALANVCAGVEKIIKSELALLDTLD
ncbi:MAG: proline--tRNA ligase [Rickettsiales bacterium]|jgi:prolyl-tRNA synthetase|nr:proline--tRNA ligase [Rickettsiales bacterium]